MPRACPPRRPRSPQAIDDAIITKVDGQATRGASGMAIYFPPSSPRTTATTTASTAAASWTDFLKTYYAEGQASGGTPEFASTTAQSQFANGGFVIGQQVVSDINQITDVYISYGYVESDGTVTLVGDESADIDSDGFATGFFDTYQLWIGDGTNETSFYSSYDVNQESDVATIGVPIAYFAAGASSGSQAFLQMSYAPSTGTILSETFYGQDDSGAYSEIAPDRGEHLRPAEDPDLGRRVDVVLPVLGRRALGGSGLPRVRVPPARPRHAAVRRAEHRDLVGRDRDLRGDRNASVAPRLAT